MLLGFAIGFVAGAVVVLVALWFLYYFLDAMNG